MGASENGAAAGGWRIRGRLCLRLLENIRTGEFCFIIYSLGVYYQLHICPATSPLLFLKGVSSSRPGIAVSSQTAQGHLLEMLSRGCWDDGGENVSTHLHRESAGSLAGSLALPYFNVHTRGCPAPMSGVN